MKTYEGIIEVLVLIMFLAVGSVGYAGWSRPDAGASVASRFQTFLEQGRTTAVRSGAGATIYFPANGGAGADVQIFRNVPDPSGAPVDVTHPIRTLHIEGNVQASVAGLAPGPFGIFIRPNGSAAAAPWTPASGAIASPACDDSAGIRLVLTTTIRGGSVQQPVAISCADATL